MFIIKPDTRGCNFFRKISSRSLSYIAASSTKNSGVVMGWLMVIRL